MTSVRSSENAITAISFRVRFLVILGSSLIWFLLSWPIAFSFDLWVFRDRSSFLNLDNLLAKHYRLGVDAFYAYGLLPVLIQHILFKLFGCGYQPMVGATIVVIILTAVFLAVLLKRLPNQTRWFVAVLLWIPVFVEPNPNFPYSLVVLSIEYALLCVLYERLDLALACAVIGCFSVPSLPLVLTLLLTACIVIQWWLTPNRRAVELLRQLAPGVALYGAIFILLDIFFGLQSTAITLLPILGSRFYKADGLSHDSGFMSFLHPAGYSLKYYLAYYTASPVTWFLLSILALVFIGAIALLRMARRRAIDYRGLAVLLCAILMVVFISVAYGNRGQHGVYESILASSLLVAISTLADKPLRNKLLVSFVLLGCLGRAGAADKIFVAWRTTAPTPSARGLFADPAFIAAWSNVVEESKHHRLLLLSYATGMSHYYPTVITPDVWFLYPGQLFPSDRQRIVQAIASADIVVVDLTSPSDLPETDPVIHAAIQSLCPTNTPGYFRTWQRCSLTAH